MLGRIYELTQLTVDNDLIRVTLTAANGLRNDKGLNAVVGLRETQITFAMKRSEARNLQLGDLYTLDLTAMPKGK